LFFTNSTNVTNFTDESSEIESGKLNILYVVMESIVATFAVIGNALVILMFCRERKLRRRTNYYIISLALVDLLVGLLGIPFAILVRQIERSFFVAISTF
jgi:adenosine receptor A2a